MSNNEMRKDYILNRWIVIASQRKWRPTDFVRPKEVEKLSICPFCPGNEHMTPRAVLVYLQRDGGIIKEKDREDFRHKNWFVDVFRIFIPPLRLLATGK